MAENSAGKQPRRGAGRPFLKGRSGNPAGKPKGTRHKLTQAAEELLDGEAEAITRKAIEMALEGKVDALRLCMDRILPPRKNRRVPFALPKIEKTEDLLQAFGAVVSAMAAGILAPDEALTIASVLEAKRKAVETVEIERRLSALEERGEKNGGH